MKSSKGLEHRWLHLNAAFLAKPSFSIISRSDSSVRGGLPILAGCSRGSPSRTARRDRVVRRGLASGGSSLPVMAASSSPRTGTPPGDSLATTDAASTSRPPACRPGRGSPARSIGGRRRSPHDWRRRRRPRPRTPWPRCRPARHWMRVSPGTSARSGSRPAEFGPPCAQAKPRGNRTQRRDRPARHSMLHALTQ